MAVIFDLDGVISDTSSIHEKAWKTVFDQVLTIHGLGSDEFTSADYKTYVDGKTRAIGIDSFLRSRQLHLQTGPKDSEDLHHHAGIGNQKNKIFVDTIENEGVHFYEDALRLLKRLVKAGVTMGIGSSSKNARSVLRQGNLENYFSVIVDGLVASSENVKSKPDGDFYIFCALKLNKEPKFCVVIEDAISGIVSAREAGVGKIIGIDRLGNENVLYEAGADLVVKSLDQLSVEDFAIGCY